MPSAKSDTKEINALRSKRGTRYAEYSLHLYTALHTQCELAVDEGYISSERAATLFEFLQTNRGIAAIYPNNVLTELLQEGCEEGGWSPDVEHDLLHFIYSIYLGYEERNHQHLGIVINAQIGEAGYTVSTHQAQTDESRPPADLSLVLTDSKLRSGKLRTALLSEYLDTITAIPDLKDKFVGFTGKFEFGTRADCFAEARKRGAVPCEPAPYMDYLFLSREFEEHGVVSSKLDSAIFFRRVYGFPQILREKDWSSIVNDG
ncbi:MAG: hypothetical protein H0X02_04710 [Nitrosomonas sp.]|nr:hypothetical protein [Nitrosomonas sp.]